MNDELIQRILEIAKNNNENNKVYITEIKKLVEKEKIQISRLDLTKLLTFNGYSLKINCDYDRFAKRRIEMAELTRQGWTMQMIADKYGITRQAVSLLLKKASEKDGQIVVKERKKNNHGVNCILVKRHKSLDKSVVCKGCGKSFCDKNKNKKTCSEECFRKIMRSGGKWSRHEFIALTCNYCGKSFERSNYLHEITMKKNKTNNHYCNKNCYLKSQTKKYKLGKLGN